MDIKQAFKIMYELASDNQLTEREVQQDINLKEEYDRQNTALLIMHDYYAENIHKKN